MTHEDYLRIAVEESARSVEEGSSPFGAVIVKDGEILAIAHNLVVPCQDPTAHAEVTAIRAACSKIKSHDLSGAILYTSCEPCPMCLNAAKWANIKEIYYACDRYDADDIGFRDKLFYEQDPIQIHHLKMPEAVQVMQKWYQSERKKPY